ncbi:MAG: CheR family methyltransferase, partial [Dissulfurispiraceae bacterium]
GVYGSHSFRGFPDDLMAKYFERTGNAGYKIRDAVRSSVEFIELNCLSESYPSGLQDSDIIFYRNVSIYFEPETRKNIFSKLAGLLSENGYLLVSSTETLSHDIGVLSLMELDGLFLYRKHIEAGVGNRRKVCLPDRTDMRREGRAARKHTGLPVVSSQKDRPAGERRKDNHLLFDQALGHARDRKYIDALRCLNEMIELEPAFVRAYTLKGSVLINMRLLDDAEGICLRSIEMDQWCLEGYLLLGLIAKMKGDEESAFRRFKEALYIRSSCWLAHFYLAEIYSCRGEPATACREYEIVVKLLVKGDLQDHGLEFFPLAFSADQIAHLCSHNLARLKNLAAGPGGI